MGNVIGLILRGLLFLGLNGEESSSDGEEETLEYGGKA